MLNLFGIQYSLTQRSKTPAMLMGCRAKNPKFSLYIEKREGSTHKLDFTLKNADNAQFCPSHDTWVTTGIPYMIYILGGFEIHIVFGDLLVNTIKAFHRIFYRIVLILS